MAQNPPSTRQYKDLLGFFEGVNSYLEPQLIKDSQVRWAENAVCKGGIWQTRPGYKALAALCLNPGSTFEAWWVAQGQPLLHPQFFTTFQPTGADPYAVFGISGSVFYAPYLPDGSIGDATQITTLQFDPAADVIVATQTVKSTDIVAGAVVNITPQKVLILQDGKSRAGYWNGLAGGHLNPQKLWTVDGTGNTIFTPGYNQTQIGLWQAWSGNRLWVFNGSQGHASDLNDPLNFTEETVLTQVPVFNFPEDVTGAIDRGTSGVQQGLLFVGTANTMWALHSGIQDRTQWASTPDFQRVVFAGAGCVAGKSMVNHRGLLYWYSGDGIVSFDSLGTVISTQALPAIDYEMTISKRRMSPHRTSVCAGFRDSYVFWSVPVGPLTNGRCYNGHTQVLDRMTVPIPSTGSVVPSGLTAWQGVWTGIRPIEWSTTAIFGQTRAICMSMDYDGVIRIWEAFQGNRADNGFQIPWVIETKSNPVTESPFVVNTFRYFQLLLEQIQGNLEIRGYYRGLRGQYHQLLDTEVTATPGSILTPTPAYSPIKNDTANESFAKQFRDIPSKNSSDGGVAPICQSSDVESIYEDAIDRSFSLLLRFRGVGALLAYRLASDLWSQNTEGEVIDPETGLHILPEKSCPQFIAGDKPDYILQDKLPADALVPYEPKFVDEDYACLLPSDIKCLYIIITQINGAGHGRAIGDGQSYCMGAGVTTPFSFSIHNPATAGLPIDLTTTIFGCTGAFTITQQPTPIGPGQTSVLIITRNPAVPCPHGAHVNVGNFFSFNITDGIGAQITAQPHDQSILGLSTANFFCSAIGDPPLTYQWQVSTNGGTVWSNLVNGANYSGVNSLSLNVINTPNSFNGYKYRLEVSNGCNSDFSDPALLTVTPAVLASVLLVGGGGGGGCRFGGGGGGGEVKSLTNVLLNASNSYPVTIGAGGAGANTAPFYRGSVGLITTLGGINTALGGGGGGGGGDLAGLQGDGSAGSSGGGGGGGGNPPGVVGVGAQGGIAAAGGNGGKGYFAGGNDVASGGGGGAGGNGANVTASGLNGGAGGPGVASSISGASLLYGGGGGGSAHDTFGGGAGGLGGTGGGGQGANPGLGGAGGAANTGGGGGGGDDPTNPLLHPGGTGGQGICIVSYPGPAQFTGGNITTIAGNTIHTFLNNGTLAHL